MNHVFKIVITFVIVIKAMSIQNRIKLVIKMHNLTASAFADKIGVQRSSVSHILTGRNNPSLDFIEKTLINFPRVNADWLIMGKVGVVESENLQLVQTTTHKDLKSKNVKTTETHIGQPEKRLIERVVIFYDDGTYEETMPLSANAE